MLECMGKHNKRRSSVYEVMTECVVKVNDFGILILMETRRPAIGPASEGRRALIWKLGTRGRQADGRSSGRRFGSSKELDEVRPIVHGPLHLIRRRLDQDWLKM